MLPRIARFFDTQRMLTLLTLIVACFSQLDIVRNAPLLDLGDDVRERRELEAQTNAFLGGIIQIIEPVVVSAPMRLMSGLLALFLERNDVGIVAKSRVSCGYRPFSSDNNVSSTARTSIINVIPQSSVHNFARACGWFRT